MCPYWGISSFFNLPGIKIFLKNGISWGLFRWLRDSAVIPGPLEYSIPWRRVTEFIHISRYRTRALSPCAGTAPGRIGTERMIAFYPPSETSGSNTPFNKNKTNHVLHVRCSRGASQTKYKLKVDILSSFLESQKLSQHHLRASATTVSYKYRRSESWPLR